MNCGVKTSIGCLLWILIFSGSVQAGDFDQLQGTETWRILDRVNPALEWDDWFTDRKAWRAARREFKAQRSRNRRMAREVHRAKQASSMIFPLGDVAPEFVFYAFMTRSCFVNF